MNDSTNLDSLFIDPCCTGITTDCYNWHLGADSEVYEPLLQTNKSKNVIYAGPSTLNRDRRCFSAAYILAGKTLRLSKLCPSSIVYFPANLKGAL